MKTISFSWPRAGIQSFQVDDVAFSASPDTVALQDSPVRFYRLSDSAVVLAPRRGGRELQYAREAGRLGDVLSRHSIVPVLGDPYVNRCILKQEQAILELDMKEFAYRLLEEAIAHAIVKEEGSAMQLAFLALTTLPEADRARFAGAVAQGEDTAEALVEEDDLIGRHLPKFMSFLNGYYRAYTALRELVGMKSPA
jgi:hypothetical protein